MASDESNLDFRDEKVDPTKIWIDTGSGPGMEVPRKLFGQPGESWPLRIMMTRPVPHAQCAQILSDILPECINLFVKRQAEYGEGAGELGSRGQYSDMHRKMIKLKRMMWDNDMPADAVSEGVDQVLMDMLGHILLALYFTRRDFNEQERRADRSDPASD